MKVGDYAYDVSRRRAGRIDMLDDGGTYRFVGEAVYGGAEDLRHLPPGLYTHLRAATRGGDPKTRIPEHVLIARPLGGEIRIIGGTGSGGWWYRGPKDVSVRPVQWGQVVTGLASRGHARSFLANMGPDGAHSVLIDLFEKYSAPTPTPAVMDPKEPTVIVPIGTTKAERDAQRKVAKLIPISTSELHDALEKISNAVAITSTTFTEMFAGEKNPMHDFNNKPIPVWASQIVHVLRAECPHVAVAVDDYPFEQKGRPRLQRGDIGVFSGGVDNTLTIVVIANSSGIGDESFNGLASDAVAIVAKAVAHWRKLKVPPPKLAAEATPPGGFVTNVSIANADLLKVQMERAAEAKAEAALVAKAAMNEAESITKAEMERVAKALDSKIAVDALVNLSATYTEHMKELVRELEFQLASTVCIGAWKTPIKTCDVRVWTNPSGIEVEVCTGSNPDSFFATYPRVNEPVAQTARRVVAVVQQAQEAQKAQKVSPPLRDADGVPVPSEHESLFRALRSAEIENPIACYLDAAPLKRSPGVLCIYAPPGLLPRVYVNNQLNIQPVYRGNASDFEYAKDAADYLRTRNMAMNTSTSAPVSPVLYDAVGNAVPVHNMPLFAALAARGVPNVVCCHHYGNIFALPRGTVIIRPDSRADVVHLSDGYSVPIARPTAHIEDYAAAIEATLRKLGFDPFVSLRLNELDQTPSPQEIAMTAPPIPQPPSTTPSLADVGKLLGDAATNGLARSSVEVIGDRFIEFVRDASDHSPYVEMVLRTEKGRELVKGSVAIGLVVLPVFFPAIGKRIPKPLLIQRIATIQLDSSVGRVGKPYLEKGLKFVEALAKLGEELPELEEKASESNVGALTNGGRDVLDFAKAQEQKASTPR
jgi:hypothetical protein